MFLSQDDPDAKPQRRLAELHQSTTVILNKTYSADNLEVQRRLSALNAITPTTPAQQLEIEILEKIKDEQHINIGITSIPVTTTSSVSPPKTFTSASNQTQQNLIKDKKNANKIIGKKGREKTYSSKNIIKSGISSHHYQGLPGLSDEDGHSGDTKEGEKIESSETKTINDIVESEWCAGSDIDSIVASQSRTSATPLLVVFSPSSEFNARKVPHPWEMMLQNLDTLMDHVHAPYSCFVSLAPGGAGSNHFVFGMLWDKNLLIVDPVRESTHSGLYSELYLIKKKLRLQKVYISATQIQKEKNLVSCGPITTELLCYYGQLGIAKIRQLFESATSDGKTKEVEQKKFAYRSIDLCQDIKDIGTSPLLPVKLRPLARFKADAKPYQAALQGIRADQAQKLKENPSAVKRPEQYVFDHSLIRSVETEDRRVLEHMKEYDSLEQQYSSNKPKGSTNSKKKYWRLQSEDPSMPSDPGQTELNSEDPKWHSSQQQDDNIGLWGDQWTKPSETLKEKTKKKGKKSDSEEEDEDGVKEDSLEESKEENLLTPKVQTSTSESPLTRPLSPHYQPGGVALMARHNSSTETTSTIPTTGTGGDISQSQSTLGFTKDSH